MKGLEVRQCTYNFKNKQASLLVYVLFTFVFILTKDISGLYRYSALILNNSECKGHLYQIVTDKRTQNLNHI